MTREHLYPRVWKTTDQKRLNTITQLDRNAGLLVKCESRPGDCANSIYEYPLASRHGLEDLNVEHYFASQGRRFVEAFDHHLENTPVEHIDRAKVITGSKVIDFPTMRIARLLEELSLTATDRTDAEQVAQKWRHAHDDLQLKTDGIYAEKCHEIETLRARLSRENKRITDILSEKGCLYREVDVLKSELIGYRDREQELHKGMIDAQEAVARFERHWRSTCNSLADRERELMAIRAAAGYQAPSDVGSAAFIAIIRNIADNEKRLTAEVEKLGSDDRMHRECNDTQARTIRKFRNEIANLKAIVGSAGGADREALVAIGKSLGLKETASLGEIMAAAAINRKTIDKLRDDMNLFRVRNAKQFGEIEDLKGQLIATNARNAVQAQTIRDYQQKEDIADAQPDAIQDLQCRVGKIERCLGEAGRASPGTHG